MDIISRRLQGVRSGGPQDVSSGRPWDGQIGPLGYLLGTWRGMSSGRPGEQYRLDIAHKNDFVAIL